MHKGRVCAAAELLRPAAGWPGMRLLFQTRVAGNYRHVFARFDRELFDALTPAFPPVRLERFDGSRAGDEVHLLLGAGPLRQRWVSRIVEDRCTDEACWFVDEGTVLPFFLRRWRHVHRVRADGPDACVVEDDIEYEGVGGWLGTRLLYPVLYLQFAARGPMYRKYFGAV